LEERNTRLEVRRTRLYTISTSVSERFSNKWDRDSRSGVGSPILQEAGFDHVGSKNKFAGCQHKDVGSLY
jgi:hypothetical protein